MEIIKTIKTVVMGGGSLLYEYSRFRIFKDPVVLNAEITGFCPLNCPFCYFKAGWKCKNKKDLSAEQWKEIFLYHKRRGIETLVITGGEPAFRPDVLQIAFEVFGKNLIIITNGIRPISKNIKCRIFLSLDGTFKTQDEWRRGKNIVKTVMENYSNDKRAPDGFFLLIPREKKNIPAS